MNKKQKGGSTEVKMPSKKTMRMVKRAVKKQSKNNPGRIKQGI